MKKLILVSFALIAGGAMFMRCQKDDTVFDCYFYTTNDTSTTTLSLYVDDVLKGELPMLADHPECGDSILANALHLQLTAGKYEFVARDQDDKKKCLSDVKFNMDLIDTFAKVGFLYTHDSGTCIVFGLYF
jgi:hypothetical protein